MNDISNKHLIRLEEMMDDHDLTEENPNSMLNNYTALSGVKPEMFDESIFTSKPTNNNVVESELNSYGEYGDEESKRQ